ncbi:cobyric acid synthase [Alicyclobacillus tolerans]|uniref:cobyric acid synthase n=1 Tax=Alicyclobacillus tolerans TaxID=90970 RepID=UPI001F005A7D|nr:cobyric acid synthase [Alicyclobacillus tolerans]MCF8564900.1 cobyric acid synthase [Alicyclobacillus tolerans]
MAKSIMVVGTASHVGKSVLTTALCRILSQDGLRVAPFKAQNMSLNSAVTPSGREIGRAQAAQAEACGILPNEHMNPVLLKPTGHLQSQVVLQGRPVGTRSARDYFFDEKNEIWNAVVESFNYLDERCDVVVLEGAGSPVEMNLKSRDIANMRCAEMADAHVILAADIDRGGVFASIVGTIQLLAPHERERVKGIVINKFRGDPSLFAEGRQWLEDYLEIPVLGVVPHIQDLGIDEEDSVSLSSERYQVKKPDGVQTPEAFAKSGGSPVRIGIVQLPHISNFTDFDPLFLEPGVQAYFCTKPEDLSEADAIVIPGTKSTVQDLAWLHERGFVTAIQQGASCKTALIGICGGYQMLGKAVLDPHHCESDLESCAGLGVMDAVTTIQLDKTTVLVKGTLTGVYGGIEVEGYEIHMGATDFSLDPHRQPFAHTRRAEVLASVDTGMPAYDAVVADAENADAVNPYVGIQASDPSPEGFVSEDGRVIGTYLHGILHNDEFRSAWLNRLRRKKGLPVQRTVLHLDELRTEAYDRLADVVREHLDMERIYEMLQLPKPKRPLRKR